MKSWIIKNYLPELTDGFYIDINSESDETSPTKLLDSSYRWRGLYVTPSPQEISRSQLCSPLVKDLDVSPDGIVDEIYKVHPGTMLHFVYIHRMKNLKAFFNSLYRDDVEIPFSKEFVYPHLNFIGLEINMHGEDLPEGLEQQLYDQWDVKLLHKQETSFLFTNEILSYLLV